MQRKHIKNEDFDWLNNYYGISISLGDPVEYSGGKSSRRGRVTGVDGHHLLIKLNGEKISKRYHPTWRIKYI